MHYIIDQAYEEDLVEAIKNTGWLLRYNSLLMCKQYKTPSHKAWRVYDGEAGRELLKLVEANTRIRKADGSTTNLPYIRDWWLKAVAQICNENELAPEHIRWGAETRTHEELEILTSVPHPEGICLHCENTIHPQRTVCIKCATKHGFEWLFLDETYKLHLQTESLWHDARWRERAAWRQYSTMQKQLRKAKLMIPTEQQKDTKHE